MILSEAKQGIRLYPRSGGQNKMPCVNVVWIASQRFHVFQNLKLSNPSMPLIIHDCHHINALEYIRINKHLTTMAIKHFLIAPLLFKC